MANAYDLTPQDVPQINTKYRKICTKFPVPESIPMLQELRKVEPVSMEGQPPVVWERGDGFQVFDKWGNMWLDFSSGVLITNAGHGRKEIVDAIVDQAKSGLLTNYCFPSDQRRVLSKKLVEISLPELDKAFILSTGSETTECAIKLAKTHGRRIGGDNKRTIVSFNNAFHGRTLASQLAGGIPALKEWIGPLDPTFVQVPFPDGYRCADTSFELFEKSLAAKGVKPEQVAGVITETYQGGGADFAPPEYIQKLRAWCDKHQVVLIMDEVQAGFGRCGTMFGFEYYGIVPDLVCMGKGISSSLPVSAVLGKSAIMNQFPPGSMTSTHTGNPICARAAVANIEVIQKDKLVENAAKVGAVMQARLDKIQAKYSDVIGARHGRGLVAGLICQKPGTTEPNSDLAFAVVLHCIKSGVLFFSPVGMGGCTVKICPPLCITEEAILEGCQVIEDGFAKALGR